MTTTETADTRQPVIDAGDHGHRPDLCGHLILNVNTPVFVPLAENVKNISPKSFDNYATENGHVPISVSNSFILNTNASVFMPRASEVGDILTTNLDCTDESTPVVFELYTFWAVSRRLRLPLAFERFFFHPTFLQCGKKLK